MRKIINSQTRKYEENVTDTLILDAVPTVNSFNGVTSDGVARAIAGGGNVPAPSEGDDGKVLTVVDGTAAWAEAQGGDVVVVTYDTTKVAEISATIKDAIAAGKPVVMYNPTEKVTAPMTSCTVNGDTVTAQFCIMKGTSTTAKTYTSYQIVNSTLLFENTGTVVPAVSLNTDAGKVLTAGSTPDTVSWQRVYPDITGNAGKVLAVNSGATGTEWVAGGGNVPVPSEGDDGKVLTVVDGTAAWADAQGGSSYTAGDGIAIENDEIKVRVKDGNPLKITEEQQGGDYASIVTPEGTPEAEGWKALEPNTYYITREYDEDHDVTLIGFSYLWHDYTLNTLAMSSRSEDATKQFDAKLHLLYISSKHSSTEIVAKSDTLSDAFTAGWDTDHTTYTYSLGTLVDTTDEGRVFHVEFTVPGNHTDDWTALAFSSSGSDYSGIDNTVQSSFLSESHVLALPYDDDVFIVGETIPGGDLYVEVDQTYNSYSSKPQSGVAVAEAIQQAIPPMPEVKSNGTMIGYRGYGAGQITEDPSTFTLTYTNSGDDADNQFQLQEYITSNNRVCTLYGRCTLNGQESATNGADTTGTITVTATDSSTVTFPIKLRQYAYQYSDYDGAKTQVSFTSEPFCFPIENCWTNSGGGNYDYVSAISVNIAGTNSGSETLDKARLDIVASWTDGSIPH